MEDNNVVRVKKIGRDDYEKQKTGKLLSQFLGNPLKEREVKPINEIIIRK